MLTRTVGLSAKAAGENLRQFTISTGSEDREGDVLEPTGIVTAHYMKNPVVLWGHDYTKLPIGRTRSIAATMDQRIEAAVEFAPGEFAQQVKTLVDSGFLRAASVGFKPLASEPLDNGGRRFTKWDLLEWSIVNIPSNPDALALAKSQGFNVSAIEQAERITLPWWATLGNLKLFIGDVARDMLQNPKPWHRSRPGELSEEEQAAVAEVARRIKPPRP